jgi:tRNA modification GTPase
MSSSDTIVAVATPPGRGAIGIIRISGSDVARIAVAVLGELPKARVARVCGFLDADGGVLDQGIAIFFAGPQSFTGEDVLELQGHGGAVVLDLIVRRLLALGCRMARAGEFSERAFLNDKLDLAQAEGIADLIDAGSGLAARAALRTLQGEFSRRVHILVAALTELRAYVEAALDFPDEEIDFLSDADLERRLHRVFADFDSITAGARQGSILKEGLRIVIAGKPNAGKSSLMNALAQREVAIVTEIPGTTRDVLREHVSVDGIPLHLIDTAGLRESTDPVEVEGVRRARAEIAQADQILYVIDAGAGEPTADELAQLPLGVPVTWVFNKIDLYADAARRPASTRPSSLFLSVKSGQGIEALLVRLKEFAGVTTIEGGAFTARRRHLDALARARAYADAAVFTLRENRAFELFAEDLRLAQLALGEITGTVTSDDLLGHIFSSFCIGK